ncbi:hypothetical protein [Novosphingobium resinovorum]|uniref:hypothetical protein n=1 Tax=Novosphingobium resinovorum TaxID=158500 RepID=UPI002ED59203|nr:hypothetical protein [Novosphingobium resinovorum]
MDDWPDEAPEDQRPRRAGEIGPNELFEALRALAGFNDNPFLVIQGQQLALVDNLLNGMEERALRGMADDEKPMTQRALLGALSPMWIYAAYELLRTWRQRCEEIIRLAASGGFDLKAQHLERETNYHHHDRELRAEQLRTARDNPEIVQRMKDDLTRTEIGFTIIEFIRVALAKHEVSSKAKNKPIAFAPGLALPDRYTGSMVYELSNGGSIIGFHSRRDLAETIRGFPTAPIPSKEDLDGFREYLRPPEVG